MSRIPMELDIWAPDWGIPSVDTKCLEVMTYAKFCGAPLNTKVTNNPFRSPSGSLPVFRHGKRVFTEFEEISKYLRDKNFCADFALAPKQCAEVVAFTQLLKEQLIPSLQYIWWVDQKNYVELSRPWYAKALPFPLNYYYPGSYQRQATAMMNALYDQDDDLSVIETGVYRHAERCITSLSTRLGDSDYLFGAHPCSLDATVYAYLAPLLKAPFPSPALQNHLKACPNLVKFITRISQRYYPHIVQDFEAKKAAADEKMKKDADSDFPNRRRNQVLAGLFATVAMTGYAVATGLVQVNQQDFDRSNLDFQEIESYDQDEEND